jgi:hypothetical protein
MQKLAVALGWVLLVMPGGPLGADPLVRSLQVHSEVREGRTWTNQAAQVELWTDQSVEGLLAVITDWPSYPRVFRQIIQADPEGSGSEFLLHEATSIPVLGVSIINRFVLRMQTGLRDDGSGFLRWTQESTDGTIDHLVGGWELIPSTRNGRSGTLIVYSNASSVLEVLPGQSLVVGIFYAGALKDTVTAAVGEARRRKEKS